MEEDHPRLAWTFKIYCIVFFKTFQQNTNLCKTTVFQPYHLSQIVLKKYVSWFLNNKIVCTPQRFWAKTISFKHIYTLTFVFFIERIYWTHTVQGNWYNNGKLGLKHEPLHLTRVRNQCSNNQLSHELMA